MINQDQKNRGKVLRIGAVSLVIAALLFVAAFLAVRLITGRGLGLRSLPRTALSLVRTLSNRKEGTQYNQGEYRDVIFLHHSTGNNLIEQGGVRELFNQNDYHFWDQSYNNQGLRDPNGKFTGYAYTVPGDNTDPDGLARVFSQRVYAAPLNALSGLLQHEVIIVKSCFAPANQISSDDQLEQLKMLYLGIRDRMAQYPNKLFIIVTTPPLNPAETDALQARRARLLANWLKSDEFLQRADNIFVYDLFDQLAEVNPLNLDYNMLRQDFRNGADSHPNQLANQEIAPVFVNSIIKVIQDHRSSQ